jgi:spore maturation protein CgeB
MNVVILGLSITSSWGNGHATTYRALASGLARLGHRVVFLERDAPWYAAHRDLPRPPYANACLYQSLDELTDAYARTVRDADAVIVGSYVPDGVAVAEWALDTARGAVAFYDIDTPVTLAKLDDDDDEYLQPALIPRFDLYLSFTGGPVLARLENDYGARRARPLYCSVDPLVHYPEERAVRWDLAYLGTYSADRQAHLEKLLIEPARRTPERRYFVAGAQFPPDIDWPANVGHGEHIAPDAHREFYNAQRFTLNLTRAAMIDSGFAPSVRLFEAAACGVPVISDRWPGIETFFEPEREILLADDTDTVIDYLETIPETERRAIGQRARQRVLAAHTSRHRAGELVDWLENAAPRRRRAALT